MPAKKRNFDLISDAAMYCTAEFLFEDKRFLEGNPDIKSIERQLKNTMIRAYGRHRFWANETRKLNPKDPTEGRVYVTLRIDNESGIISGDVHFDIQRTDWEFSWRSDAAFSIDEPSSFLGKHWSVEGWDLFCVGTVFTPEGSRWNDEPSQIAVAIKIGKNRVVNAARIQISTGKGSVLRDYSLTDNDLREPYSSYRYVTPNHLISSELKSGGHAELVESALGGKGETLKKLLHDSHSGIYWESEKHDLRTVRHQDVFRMLAPYQWSSDPYTFAALFTTMDPDNPENQGGVPTLDHHDTTHRHRFAAVIYVDSIVDAYMAQVEGNWTDHKEALIQKIQHVYVHELGHLLNIPHTWQRGHFANPTLSPDPDAVSWMGYGSRFPLGGFMETSRNWLAKKTGVKALKLRNQYSHKVNEEVLKNPKFTDEEEVWIKHAPFDHVTPGGPYFTMRDRNPLMLRGATKPNKWVGFVSLEVELKDAPKDKEGVHELSKGAHGNVLRQPLFGTVTLKVTRDFAKNYPIHFAFQSPMLSLLVRAEYPYLQDRNFPRRVLELPCAQVPSNWEMIDAKGKPEPSGISELFHANISNSSSNPPGSKGTDVLVFQSHLPILNSAFNSANEGFFDKFGKETEEFTLQAGVKAHNFSKPIFSDQMRIRFVENGASYSNAEARVLADPMLGVLTELIRFFPKANISNLARPQKHGSGFDRGVLAKLVGQITKLKDLTGPSPTLMNYLKARASATQKPEDTFNEEYFKTLKEDDLVDFQQFLQPSPELYQKLNNFISTNPNS